MENFFYLFANVASQFLINNTTFCGTMHKEEYVCLQTDEEELNIKCFPFSEEYCYAPKQLCVKTINGQVLCTSSNVVLYKISKNAYKLVITYPKILTYSHKKLLKSKNINKNTLMLFDGTIQYILLHTENATKQLFLNYKVDEPEFCEFNHYYAIKARHEDNQYIMIFDNNLNVLFEGIDNEIEIKGKQIITLHKLFDICNHGYVTKYALQNGIISKTDEYCVYLNNAPLYANNPHTIILAFLEALNVKNLKLSRCYLSFELNDCLNDNQLLQYFGEYEEFEPNFFENCDDSVLFYYKNNICKKFCFSVKDNKIVDITTN